MTLGKPFPAFVASKEAAVLQTDDVSPIVRNGETLQLSIGKHIVRRYLGDSSAPLKEGNNPNNDAWNDPIWTAIGASGSVYDMRPGSLWRMTKRLDLIDNSGLEGPGKGKAEFVMPTDNFDSLSDLPTKYALNNLGFIARGGLTTPFTPRKNVKLCGFTVRSERTGNSDQRIIRGALFSNCIACLIEDMEFTGFPIGGILLLQTCLADVIARNCYIHDNFTDYVFTAFASFLSGIEVDNDAVNNNPSVGVLIDGCTIHDQHCPDQSGGGNQADAVKSNRENTIGLRITHCDFRRVGQGIDSYGLYGMFDHNYIDTCDAFNIVLKYTAQWTQIVHNMLRNAKIQNIRLAAQIGVIARHMINNLVACNLCDGAGTTPASDDHACIAITEVGAPTVIADNNTVRDNILNPGGAWNVTNDRCTVGRNWWRNNAHLAKGSTAWMKQSTAKLAYETTPAKRTFVRVYNAAGMASVGASGVLTFDNAPIDVRGEWDDANDRFQPHFPGIYRIRAQYRISDVGNGTLCQINIRKNAATLLSTGVDNGSATDDSATPHTEWEGYLLATDQVDITFAQSSGGSRTIGGGERFTYMTIEHIR